MRSRPGVRPEGGALWTPPMRGVLGPTGRRPGADPGHTGDNIPAGLGLSILLEEVARGGKVWTFLLGLLAPRPRNWRSGSRWMDGFIFKSMFTTAILMKQPKIKDKPHV